MACSDTEKNSVEFETEQVCARVRKGLHEAMKAAIPPGTNIPIGLMWTKAAEVFLQLPAPTRSQILAGKITDPLVDIVSRIVNEKIEAGRKAGEALAKRQRRKPDQKGL